MTINEKQVNFIIIDDSELDCFIAEKMLRHLSYSQDVRSFLQAGEALEYIKKNNSDNLTVIVLDVLMPIMNGVEFVEEFEKLPLSIRANYKIVALTSSMNKKDMSRIKSYQSVTSLFDKPLSADALSSLLEEN
jgi:CheY-like chemotaxis protein